MQKMKWSVIAFAVAAASTQMAVASQQSESNGFIEDSKLDVHARTLYFNRDQKNNKPRSAQSYSEDFGLGLKAIYESGFTQGTVGFGVDAFAMTGIRLDSGRGRNGNGQFPTRDNGKPETTYGEVGGAIKARISNTTLKYGEQFVDLPVLSMDDARLLPESTTGFLVTSEEIDGLVLHAGHFTAINALDQTGRDSANGGLLRSIDLAGARYNFTDDLSAAYYYSDADLGHKGVNREKAKKQYLNVNYVHPIADDQSVTVDFNAYSTRFQDKEAAADRTSKNNIRSLSVAYNLGAHTFTVGGQKVEGNHAGGYDYGYDGGGAVYVLNDVQYYWFGAKGEKSYQARYDLDFAQYGIPGLSFMTRYVRGSKIEGADGRRQGKNWERDTDIAYTVQSGAAKDLSMRVRNATYRSNSAAIEGGARTDVNEVRFIVEYPLSIL
ncbi:OprD family porin [Thiopseudomonas denitrificans]|uniref:Imipenem/basic amino acid-specific outer membrane pore n=1 Tax=Thiopseudomonas denitrificans TaxID=1501432 RepID=A0A4R6TYH7_9GAMM|nr:OprD family porin [Thiopseudomonas denitrificans]TDQ38988.1 imipenem/basic amino acid-specific outer membrane pore [Thiopseudomonas denitrificans]